MDAADCGEGEFWLGNEYIYAMQNRGEKTALKVSLARNNGDKGVISYSDFKIAAERQKYQLQKADGFKDDECGAKVGNSLAGMNFGAQVRPDPIIVFSPNKETRKFHGIKPDNGFLFR